jgi:hypothetical protein
LAAVISLSFPALRAPLGSYKNVIIIVVVVVVVVVKK